MTSGGQGWRGSPRTKKTYEPRLCATTGKHQYRSVKVAERYAGAATEARGTELRIYRCEFCDLYHLTSKPRVPKEPAMTCRHGIVLAAWCYECAEEPLVIPTYSDAEDRIIEDDEEYERG